MFDTNHVQMANHMIGLVFANKTLGKYLKMDGQQGTIKQRIISIKAACDSNRMLLYQFNKSKFDAFLGQKQNVILLEYFLNEYKQYVGACVAVKPHDSSLEINNGRKMTRRKAK